MNETELYKELGSLTKDKSRWKESIPDLAGLLNHESVRIKAKALWLLGETGFMYPDMIEEYVPAVAAFLDSSEALLRERAVNALGRIGRGSFHAIERYWRDLFRLASDKALSVRLAFIWASENIATNTPDVYGEYMEVFEVLLHDAEDRVRMESPEIFRVLAKCRPDFVKPFAKELQRMAQDDANRVVRIHSSGALKALGLV